MKPNPAGFIDYNPKNRHNRKESDRFKSFTYDDLIKRDKANLVEQFATIADDLKKRP